jgi:hypothetical protein
MSAPSLAFASLFLLAWTPLPSAVAPETVLDAPPLTEVFYSPATIATDGEGAFVTATRSGSRGWDRFFYGGALGSDGVSISESGYIAGTSSPQTSSPVAASSGDGNG